MYPPSLLWWLGGAAILFGILGLIGLLALAVDRWFQRHNENDDAGRSAVWLVFEVLSAVFVIAGLLTMIYSDSQLLRAIGGTAYVVIVATAAAFYVHAADKPEGRPSEENRPSSE